MAGVVAGRGARRRTGRTRGGAPRREGRSEGPAGAGDVGRRAGRQSGSCDEAAAGQRGLAQKPAPGEGRFAGISCGQVVLRQRVHAPDDDRCRSLRLIDIRPVSRGPKDVGSRAARSGRARAAALRSRAGPRNGG